MARTSEEKSPANSDKGKTPQQLNHPAFADGLATRIGTSTSQLLKTTLNDPDQGALKRSLDVATSTGSKVPSSNASSSTKSGVEVGQSSRSAGSLEGSFRGAGQPRSDTGTTGYRTQEDFDHFVSQHISLTPEVADTGVHESLPSTDVESAAAQKPQNDTRRKSTTQDGLENVHPSDGSAVVELLSRTGATLDASDFQDLDADGLQPVNPAEGASDYSFKSGKLQEDESRIKPLSLVPDWSLVDSDVMTEETMRQWLNVLDNYHDEVWGPDLPTVKSAKQDLNNALKAKHGLQLTQSPAIQRLRMLLAHMHPAT